jgi:hypothetical protein
MIADALLRAREQALDEALIDITRMSGFESPGPAFRRWAVSFWSRTACNEVRVAMVARQEHICPEKTGLLVAAEEGLHANIFDDESEALDWLGIAARR